MSSKKMIVLLVKHSIELKEIKFRKDVSMANQNVKKVELVEQREVLGKDFKIYGSIENPLFLAKDVAEWIDYSKSGNGSYNLFQMLSTIDEDEKLILTMLVAGQNRQVTFLTEQGLYEVLMQSRKPIAKQFKKAVKQILKQIRLTGGYVQGNRENEFIEKYFPSFSEETKLKMLFDLKAQNDTYKTQLQQQKPLVEFAEHVGNTSKTISMNEMSKLLQKQGIRLGRNKLFEYLRQSGIFMKNARTPYQQYITNGYFKIVETNQKGVPYIATRVTGKGQQYLVKKIREEFLSGQ